MTRQDKATRQNVLCLASLPTKEGRKEGRKEGNLLLFWFAFWLARHATHDVHFSPFSPQMQMSYRCIGRDKRAKRPIKKRWSRCCLHVAQNMKLTATQVVAHPCKGSVGQELRGESKWWAQKMNKRFIMKLRRENVHDSSSWFIMPCVSWHDSLIICHV